MLEYEEEVMGGTQPVREADFNLVIPRGAGRMVENSTAGRVSERTKPAVDVLKERRIVKVTEVATRRTQSHLKRSSQLV